ncbi:unnamed protein product [Merluccius merluccius]
MGPLRCIPVLVLVLALCQGAGGQVCDWDQDMDARQGLEPGSAARRLAELRDVRDAQRCREACCAEPACQLALVGDPEDGDPQGCLLVSCLLDGRDVCVLTPSTQFRAYRKKSQEEPGETKQEEPEEQEEQAHNSTLTTPQAPDARAVDEEENTTNTEYCRRPMAVGPCRAAFRRFYYDSSTQTCKPFVYGGCLSNRNNFHSQEECAEACQGVTGPDMMMEVESKQAVRSLSDLAPSQPDRCGAEPEVGLCRAALPRWFYNSKTRTCETFIYGGCRGNQNNYASQEACMVACTVTVLPSSRKAEGKSVTMETKDYNEYCMGSPEPGPCRAAFPRFYYQASTASCSSFIYGGCQGNKNRYETLEGCMSQCDGKAVFLIGTLAVISVLILTGLIMITLHRSGFTRRSTSVSDKEELLPQQGDHSSVESLAIPESPKTSNI